METRKHSREAQEGNDVGRLYTFLTLPMGETGKVTGITLEVENINILAWKSCERRLSYLAEVSAKNQRSRTGARNYTIWHVWKSTSLNSESPANTTLAGLLLWGAKRICGIRWNEMGGGVDMEYLPKNF